MKASERQARPFFVDDDEPADRALYEEYVRGFDDIPVLEDAVRIPPRRSLPASFVRGERKSLRREERPDAFALRDATRAELEIMYGEYVAPENAKPKKKSRAKKKTATRTKRRRKSSAAA